MLNTYIYNPFHLISTCIVYFRISDMSIHTNIILTSQGYFTPTDTSYNIRSIVIAIYVIFISFDLFWIL